MSEQIVARRTGRPPRVDVYHRLSTQLRELWENLGGLPTPLEAEGIWREIWLEEAHHSTAIEGNTLVLKQVEILLAEGRAVGDKELREYMEVKGYADAADWVYGQARSPGEWKPAALVSLTEIRQLHRLLLQPVWDVAPHPQATDAEAPGSFREHEIHPFPGGMTPVSWVHVPAELSGWIDELARLDRESPVFAEDLAKTHLRFEQIHPFLDGNGRAGRLVMNLLLVRLGFPPAIIYKRQRTDYLTALRRADQGDAGSLGELLARAILDSLYRFIVPAVAGPARLVPLAALADQTVTSHALRVAAIRGRLQATQGSDGQWRSSRSWVDDYLKTRYRRESP